MKKKILFMLSTIMLLICIFAISVSASVYTWGLDTFSEEGLQSFYMSSMLTYNNMNMNGEVVEDIELLFGYQVLELENLDGETNRCIIVFNIDSLHSYLVEKNIDSYSEFELLPNYLIEDGLVPLVEGENSDFHDSYLCNDWYFYFGFVWNCYQSYLAEINAPTYEEGKTDGISEGYVSGKADGIIEGYNSGKAEGITEGYNSGKAEGITEGYNSGKAEGYELGSLNGEKVGYIDGYKSGYTNYKLSTEYKSALENKYSSGFKEGAASVEQEESDMTLAILIPSIVIECILGIFLTVFLSRKKQRRKNK